MCESKTITVSAIMITLAASTETFIYQAPLRGQEDQKLQRGTCGWPLNTDFRGNIMGQLFKRSLASV